MKKTKNLLTKICKCLLVFGIIFSQLSFPLSVLADEVLENNEVTEVVEEQENEQTETNNGEIEEVETTEEITEIENDTENKLTEEDTTTEENNTPEETNPSEDNTNTEEDNNEENTEEDNTTEEEPTTPEEEKGFTIEKLEQETENLYIIKNESEKAVTIKNLRDREVNAIITDCENNEVTEENKEIISNYQITIIDEEQQEVSYRIIVLADYNSDGIVNEEDQTILLGTLKSETKKDENINIFEYDFNYDLNKDKIFNILDVTYPIFIEKNWENDKIAKDTLANKLTSDEEVLIEEEIDVDYIVEGFTEDKLVGIQGILNYNKELLQLTKVTVNGIEQDVLELENGNFAYLLTDYNTDGVLITFTFKALDTIEDEVVVAMEDIVASIGGVSANIDVDNISTSFKISDGKGGDVGDDTTGEDIPGDDTTEDNTTEEDNKEENVESTPKEETTTPEQTVVTTPVVVAPTQTNQTTNNNNYLSSNNYINSLTINGYELDFNKNTYEYSINVKSDVSSLDLSILLGDNDATYYIEGNENFKVGENNVKIIVTAENGNKRTYTIKVNKEEDKTIEEETEENDEDEKEEKSSTSKTIIIILIILVIIGLIYVIFKDDEEDDEENSNTKNSKNNTKNTKNSQKSSKKGSKKQ